MSIVCMTAKGTASATVGAALLAALCLGGCSTTAGIEANGKTAWNQDGKPELSTKVVINNSSLAGDVEIVDMKSSLAGNLMIAQVSLRSTGRGELPLQYRFAWYDAQGMELNAATGGWNPLTIYGRESKMIRGVAPDPRAHEFKLKLREAE